MDREERFEKRQWKDAIREIKRAYDQFSDFEWKVANNEPKRAARHLRKAIDDFNAAITHIEKANVGEAGKAAVDEMNHGINELDEAVTSFGKATTTPG